MKSAGELRRNHSALPTVLPPSNSATSSPQRPTMSHYATPASSSNLLLPGSPPQDNQMPKRFASLGVSAGMLSTASLRHRPAVDTHLWETVSPEDAETKLATSPPLPHKVIPMPRSQGGSPPRNDPRPPKEEKSNRWGFLKKMSMGKMRTETPSLRPSTSHGRPSTAPHPRLALSRPSTATNEGPRMSITPQIDVRISTTGLMLNSPVAVLPPSLSKKPSADLLKAASPPMLPPPAPSSTQLHSTATIPELPLKAPLPQVQETSKSPVSNLLLVPPTNPTPRAAKRRSFLPFDVSPIPIPAAANFVTGVTATNDTEECTSEGSRATPSPVIPQESLEQIQRREEEKARDARTRALRSVMAYLRDMYDLGLTQANTMSMYGGG